MTSIERSSINDTTLIVKPNENKKAPIYLNSIYVNKKWKYLILENRRASPLLSTTKIITVDSIYQKGDSVLFNTTEIDVDNKFLSIKNDTSKNQYLQFNGQTSKLNEDKTLSEPGIFFHDGPYILDSLKEYTNAADHFIYYLEYSREELIPYQTNFGYSHRLLYASKIGLIESTDSTESIDPYYGLQSKSIKLLSIDEEIIDSNKYEGLK